MQVGADLRPEARSKQRNDKQEGQGTVWIDNCLTTMNQYSRLRHSCFSVALCMTQDKGELHTRAHTKTSVFFFAQGCDYKCTFLAGKTMSQKRRRVDNTLDIDITHRSNTRKYDQTNQNEAWTNVNVAGEQHLRIP